MATLMEKEAAIEILSGTVAHIYRYQNRYGETEEMINDRSEATKRKHAMYSTHHDDIDFPEMIAFKTRIKAKYPE